VVCRDFEKPQQLGLDAMVDLAVGGVDCGPDHFLEKCAPALSISPFAQPRYAASATMKLIAAILASWP
jgi:hypothetical protein